MLLRERMAAGKRLYGNYAESKYIARGSRACALEQFGSHVVRRPADILRCVLTGQCFVQRPRKPEIRDDRTQQTVSLLRQDYVRAFEIGVEYSGAVCFGECFSQEAQDPGRFGRWWRSFR
jgi:hypothetical protein